MPEEGIALRDKSEFMRQEELLEIAATFVKLGIKKIRLTGGEPLIKKNFASILHELSKLPVELAITTNAVLLDQYIADLKKANVKKLNISLDSLQEKRFNKISRRNSFKRIWKNIHLAIEEGFTVKLNVVLIKDFNSDEIIDFIQLSQHTQIDIRFIEFMPFSGNEWDWSKKVSYQTIRTIAENHFGINNIQSEIAPTNSTSKNFRITGYKGDFGIISTLTNPFCDTCNRIRLTADGKVKNCLFSSDEADILTALRNGKAIEPLIQQIIKSKKETRAGIESFTEENGAIIFKKNRSMTTIGG